MIALILAMLCSMTIALVMRLGSQKTKSELGMLSVNYMVCAALAAVYTLPGGGPLPRMDGLGAALALGTVCGVLFLAAFVMLQWNTMKNGVVLSSVFMKLGVLVPTVMSVLVFHETPGAAQIAGFVLAVAAIILMNLRRGSGSSAKSALGLLALLLLGGMADAMSKIYEQLGSPALESQYLLYTFAVALALCLALTLARGQKIGRGELLFGAVLGIPNFFSAKFLLQSLSTVPAVVAYPTFSVGTIVLTALCGMIFFREKLSRQQLVAMALILCALDLLNL